MNTEWLPPPDETTPAPFRTGDHPPWVVRDEPWAAPEGPGRAGPEEAVEGSAGWTPTGRLVNLRFLRSALRRLRWLWLATATLGLAGGLAYHLAVPLRYTATATLFLVQPATGTAAPANDLAMLDTPAVSKRALALLGEQRLSPTALLGKQPGTMLTSNNVLVLTISGPSSAEAVRRVDAVAKAFLAFRAQRYEAETRAVLAAEHRQLRALERQVSALESEISRLRPATSTRLDALDNQRGIDTTEIAGLESSIQQSAIGSVAVSKGSRVISPGTALPVSEKKVLGLDGMTGLAGGLGGGLLLATVIAVLSDRPRSREDVASLLGVPVDLSLPKVRGRAAGPARHLTRPSIWDLSLDPADELSVLARYLGARLSQDQEAPCALVLAIDEVEVTAAAMLLLANDLALSGRQPVLVDATVARELAQELGIDGVGTWAVGPATGPPLHLLVPPQPWEDGDVTGEPNAPEGAVFLVLATVDPAVGAEHLRRWSGHAVVALAAGGSSAQRVSAIGELLRAADVAIGSVVLLDADPHDESAGRTARPAWDR